MVRLALSSRFPSWEGSDDPSDGAAGGFGAGIEPGARPSASESGDADASQEKPARKRRVRKKSVRKKPAASDAGAEGADGDSAPESTEPKAKSPEGDEPRSKGSRRRSTAEPDGDEASAEDGEERGGRKRRRRGSRGGRRRKRGDEDDSPEVDVIPGEEDELPRGGDDSEREADEDKPAARKKKRTRRKSRRKASEEDSGAEPEADATAEGEEAPSDSRDEEPQGEGGKKKRRRRRSRKKATGDADSEAEPEAEPDGEAGSTKKTRRRSKKSGAATATKTAEEKAAEAEAMRTQTIAVNAVEPEERRVAVYENGRIEDILMTAESQKTLVNDIYRGRVVNLEPAIGAAFIDFGQGRNGFLHTSDVLPIYADDDFQLEDLLTGGHHDEEGDHDADWSEEADALDEEHHDDDDELEEEAGEEAEAAPEPAASEVQEPPAAEAEAEDEDTGDERDSDQGDPGDEPDDDAGPSEDDPAGDDDGPAPGFAQGIVDEDAEAEEPRGTRSLRSRSRRPASSRVAAMDDGDAPSGDDDGKPARKKRKRRSSKKKAASAGADGESGSDGDGEEGGRKRSSSRKRSRKKATASDKGAEDGAKKSAKKKTSKKAERKSKKKASSRRKASKGGSKGGGSRSRGRSERRPQRERRPIDQLLKVGDPVVVQVTKDAIGDKGPTLTTYISMPGRYLVLMPSMSRTGVSRKIPDDKERKRLKRILASLKTPADMGVIVRTAGVGRTKADLQRDLDYLLGLWESFGKKLRGSRGPAPLYLESDVATRTLRDLFNRRTKEVLVDDFTVYEQMVSFAEKLMPEHVGRIKRYEGDRPLFQESGLEQEFERIFSRRVDLPSGGSIVLDQAEALVAIDVNSGRTRTDSYDFEDIALKTNMEAVPEIARQIKLRDLGGIIVCDFIDMVRSSSNRQVERALREALADDRARSKLGRISQFGLLEMTRQRLGPGTHKKVFQACPRCRGTGRVRTVESRAQAILRRLGGAVVQKGFSKVEVRAHPEVVQYLKEDLWDWVRALEHRSEKQIELSSVPDQLEDSVLRYLRADGREVRPGGRRKR
jgi:ribonuclease E